MKPLTKRYILIGLMVVTGLATLGIIAAYFLAGGRGAEEFAMLSAMGLGFLVLISFAATTTLDHRIWKFPALIGMAISIMTMFIHPFMAFLESNRIYSYPASTAPSFDNSLLRFVERLDGTGFTLAGLLCLTAFVMAPNIKFLGRLLQLAVAGSYLILFVFFQFVFWDYPFHDRDAEKLLFAVFIFAAAGTIAVSLLNKFFGIKITVPVTYASATLHLTCPRCQTPQDLPLGESACRSCKLKFKIDIEEPCCPKCNYNLHNLTTARCPEFGTEIPTAAQSSAPQLVPPT